MSQLKAASCLEELRNAPGKFHALRSNRTGQVACALEQPMRLIFEPADNPLPILADNVTVDWAKVKSVRILEIKDYHND